MIYNGNKDLVQEILDFAKTGKPNQEKGNFDARILVNDFNTAKRMAWIETYPKDEHTWTSIRENEASEILEAANLLKNYDELSQEFDPLHDIIFKNVDQWVPSRYDDFVDDISGDLINCAYARFIMGDKHRFFELLFRIYNSGGWPCGWVGDYPVGQPMVFLAEI